LRAKCPDGLAACLARSSSSPPRRRRGRCRESLSARPPLDTEESEVKQTFHMIPASTGSIWFLGIICLVLLGLVALLIYLTYSARNTSFEISAHGLRIAGSVYGRTIPSESLISEQIKPVNLHTDSAYRIRWRTNGAGLPGYNTGWFRLRNREKALLFLTDRSRAVYIPTRDRYSVLLSVAEPIEFVRVLRESLAPVEG
jgi:hypothetical protein